MNAELQDLDRQIAELQARRDALFRDQRHKAIRKVRELAERFNLSHAQMGIGSMSRTQRPTKTKTKRPATFYDASRGLAWDGSLTGKGRKPDWIRKAVEDRTIESFRVMVQKASAPSVDGAQEAHW